MTTIPMSLFVLGGHLLSATATAKIPVSTVHTIKGLSPLITVAAYRLIYNLSYPIYTYLSLIPLTLGVMLACSADFRGNIFGITFAFLSTIVFVAQNIFSKRLFNEAAATEASGIPASRMKKPDKLNLLCYSSGLAFLLTAPIWFWSEGITILGDFLHDGSLDLITHEKSLDHGRLALEFVFNGVTHFGQNILAFVLLSMVSPVTYSVASLIKRVFVIILAIFWFGSHLTRVQWVGVLLTFIGLYLYDRTSQNKAERKARMMTVKEEPVLPLTNRDLNISGSRGPSPVNGTQRGYTNDYALKPGIEDKKSDDPPGRGGRVRATSSANRGLHGGWMPPGTKQEETWRPNLGDLNGNNGNGAKISVS
jgi:solute carrier family 35 protein E1